MNIYLIGMPASGKTTFGKKLAKKLGYNWCDLDEQLEDKYQKSIDMIVAEEGENSFRQKERIVLHESLHIAKTVISTGGGCPCFFDNILVMKQNAWVIFLNTDLTRITNRIMRSQNKRFMFENCTKRELLNKIQVLYSERKKYYTQAHRICNLENLSNTNNFK